MIYAVDTPQQLKTILRALRQARGLTQTQLGEMIGVSQKRVARIEGAPEKTAFDQIARIFSVLGCRLSVDEPPKHQVSEDRPEW